MSTTTSTRRTSATPTTFKTETALPSVLLPDDLVSTTTSRHAVTNIQFDTDKPTPTTVLQDESTATTSGNSPVATCSSNRDCASDKVCSRGACVSTLEAAPLGGGAGSTTSMSTGVAIGVGLGVVAIIALLMALGFCFWKRRNKAAYIKSFDDKSSSNRNRSASSATDQKTLVASPPTSPQDRQFRGQEGIMLPAAFAKLHDVNSQAGQKTAHGRQQSSTSAMNRKSTSTDKALPLAPTDMPLPLEPVEEKRYAINVNINKSMIFDDEMMAISNSRRTSQSSRDRMPKYRFEEYLPPVASTPRLSLSQKAESNRSSAYEMGPYPRKNDAGANTDGESDDDSRSRKSRVLKKLESGPPQLPLPDLPPPSPSFSFRSYDWYQDIIGTERTDLDDDAPSIPNRSPARTPTKASFGDSLYPNSLNPFRSALSLSDTASSRNSYLHPKAAALPSPATLPSPTAANFRLSPTVYTMPSGRPKPAPTRASLQSTTTAKTHMSRSWLPEDGLYLPEEGTRDTFTMYSRRLDDDSRPTSYTPL